MLTVLTTISSRINKNMQVSTAPYCQCGAHIKNSMLVYYTNQFGERIPICHKCIDAIAPKITLEELKYLFNF